MHAVVMLDDIELDDGNSVIATTRVTLGWDGEWYELDLTDEHAADLANGLRPYLDAARRQEARHPAPTATAVESARGRAAIQAAEADPSIPRYGRVVLYHAVGITKRKYFQNFRAWAKRNGYEIHQAKDNTYYHPVDLVEEYERHLSLMDRRRTDGESRAS